MVRRGASSRSSSSARDAGGTERLKKELTQAVARICDDFALVQQQQQKQSGRGSSKTPDAYATDYDLYYGCCQRLVTYIADNMETSPDFVQQMDRVILACHSNAPERVLRSVVKKQLWFHRRDENADEIKVEKRRARSPSPQPVVSSKRQRVVPLRKTVSSSPPPKRTRRDAQRPKPLRRSRTAAAYGEDDDEEEKEEYAYEHEQEEEEEEEEEEEQQDQGYYAYRKRSTRAKRIQPEEEHEDEDEEDDDEPVFVKKGRASAKKKAATKKSKNQNQPHYEQADQLLTFKDAIGELCSADKRTPAQTKFFKERLRKSIQFVDAQLCRPPPGMVCSRDCRRLRAQMCNSDQPCKNKVCVIWHDVEAHTDRCLDTTCEFRNRIMLRETMHKIDHRILMIQNYKAELVQKKKALKEVKTSGATEREQFIETTLLENEISQLERDITQEEQEMEVFKATKRAFWAGLNDIGIELKDDALDNFPDYDTHYVPKKIVVKAPRAAPKAASAGESASPPGRRGRGAPIQVAETDENGRIIRRTTRRSTTTTRLIEIEDDDEGGSKGEESGELATKENSATTNEESKENGSSAVDESKESTTSTTDASKDQVITIQQVITTTTTSAVVETSQTEQSTVVKSVEETHKREIAAKSAQPLLPAIAPVAVPTAMAAHIPSATSTPPTDILKEYAPTSTAGTPEKAALVTSAAVVAPSVVEIIEPAAAVVAVADAIKRVQANANPVVAVNFTTTGESQTPVQAARTNSNGSA